MVFQPSYARSNGTLQEVSQAGQAPSGIRSAWRKPFSFSCANGLQTALRFPMRRPTDRLFDFQVEHASCILRLFVALQRIACSAGRASSFFNPLLLPLSVNPFMPPFGCPYPSMTQKSRHRPDLEALVSLPPSAPQR